MRTDSRSFAAAVIAVAALFVLDTPVSAQDSQNGQDRKQRQFNYEIKASIGGCPISETFDDISLGYTDYESVIWNGNEDPYKSGRGAIMTAGAGSSAFGNSASATGVSVQGLV